MKLKIEIEHNKVVNILFIDFKQAFDSLKRRMIPIALTALGINTKLIKLVMTTLQETSGKVLVQNYLSQSFDISSGVKQGDSLLATIFNLVLHYAIQPTAATGHLFNKTAIIIAYADDIAILSRSKQHIMAKFQEIQQRAAGVGLIINQAKTKYMKVSKEEQRRSPENLTIDQFTFEGVECFKYLGVLITSSNETNDCLQDRIMAANRCFYAHANIFKTNLISRSAKLRAYKAIIRTVLCYGAEIWSLSNTEEQQVRVFERKNKRRATST